MSAHLRCTVDGPLARITLDRPPLNVLTTAMMRELAAELDRVSAMSAVRVLRLDAEGKAFSAGVDVADHEGDLVKPMMDALRQLFDALARVPVPTVSIVQGAALGGGCELVLGTDICLASDRATFGQPEIRLGLFAPPASVLLPRIVGERRAMMLLLTGETIPASEAQAIGIVQRVFPADTLAAEADAWIGKLLEMSGAALRLTKRAVATARNCEAGVAQRAVQALYMDELMKTEDANEGVSAFIAKRRPEWKHR